MKLLDSKEIVSLYINDKEYKCIYVIYNNINISIRFCDEFIIESQKYNVKLLHSKFNTFGEVTVLHISNNLITFNGNLKTNINLA